VKPPPENHLNQGSPLEASGNLTTLAARILNEATLE